MSVSAKKNPTRVTICCRTRDPFQGPKLGSCLTLGNELSEETRANKGNLVRVSDPRSEDDISDSVYSGASLPANGPDPAAATGTLLSLVSS